MRALAAIRRVLDFVAAADEVAWLAGPDGIVAVRGEPMLAAMIERHIERLTQGDHELRLDGVARLVCVRALPSGYRLGVLRDPSLATSVVDDRLDRATSLLAKSIVAGRRPPRAPPTPSSDPGPSGAPALLGLDPERRRRH